MKVKAAIAALGSAVALLLSGCGSQECIVTGLGAKLCDADAATGVAPPTRCARR